MSKKVTIKEVADRAGVSVAAASYALNGVDGVSLETRKHVRAIAEELRWKPRAGKSRAASEAIGLVLALPPITLSREPFFMEFIAGAQRILPPAGMSLLLTTVNDAEAEAATLRRWHAGRLVAGVMLVNLTFDDPRIPLVQELGLPAVVVGNEDVAAGLPCLPVNEGRGVQEAIRYLVRLGHRNIARVAGPFRLGHVHDRNVAFLEELADAGLPPGLILETDFSGEEGARATRSLLTSPAPPTAVIYDNDVLAIAGLGVAGALGVQVPSEVSLLAWDDSALCELTHPPLSAMRRDIEGLGAEAVRLLLRVIAGEEAESALPVIPHLHPRSSTAVVAVTATR